MSTAQEFVEPDCFYHVYNRAVGNELLFFRKENYIYFLEKYKKYLSPIVNTFAYCLIPNHFHFLIRIKPLRGFQTLAGVEPGKLVSRQFSHLFNSYAQAINKQQGRKGSLFKNRFKRIKVDDDTYLKQLILYIHLNPSNHGICESYRDWKYSSFSELINKQSGLLNCDEVINWFGGLDNFIYCHNIKFELDDEYSLEAD